MAFVPKITKRTRKRKLKSGEIVLHTRHVLNFADPVTGARRQVFRDTKREAEALRAELMATVAAGAPLAPRAVPTVAQAVDQWLIDREGKVKPSTLAAYKVVLAHVRGPVLVGTADQRAEYRLKGKVPKGTKLRPMLGTVRLTDLTTAAIRLWHRDVAAQAGSYTATRAKALLKAVLALAEEDHGVRAPSMPGGLGRARAKPKKVILSTADIGRLLDAAAADGERGIYYAFPFLAGTRPSEQLGLLWEDVDFVAGVVRIRRIQERTGELTEMTKTEAGTREIPMGRMLREMMLAWRLRCPRKAGELHQVFPGPGRMEPWPSERRVGGGGPLLYQNFRKRFWEPAFKRLNLPYVTPHSARHAFISNLQRQGIEVGLVAKLAGHANASVTLGHYTQAVRGGEAAMSALEGAYGSRG